MGTIQRGSSEVKRAIITLVAAASLVLSPIAAVAEEGTDSSTTTATQAPLAPGEECDAEDRDESGHCVGVPLVVWLGGAVVIGGIACAAGGCTSGGGGGQTTQTTGTP
jgi:hypothetical protein